MAEMISVAAAASALGVVPQTIRQAIKAGHLIAEKRSTGKQGSTTLRPSYVVDAASVEQYRQEHLGKVVPPRRASKDEVAAMHAEGYLTTTEAAQMIGIPSSYLSRLVAQGTVPGVRKEITYVHRRIAKQLAGERRRKLARMEAI